MKKKVRPNVVSGGSAIDLGNGLFYMRGRTHKQGGIDIGSNPRTGIEVENGEIYDTNKGRVFSAQPILNGISPANALLMGGNPNNIFNAQEAWKQIHHYNDDGTKFKGGGYTPSKEILDYIKKTEGFRDKWYQDGNGIWTIGYGFTGDRIKKLYPNGITREQADKEFADSIIKRALILAKDTPNWDSLTQNQRDALLSYHYNIGEGSYRNKHKGLQKALTEKNWDAAIANIDAGYNDKKNPGLRKRRDYERELFRSGSITSLTGDEENAFQNWYSHYSTANRLNADPDAKEHYYDYRGYWKNRTKEDEKNELVFDSHLPDTYKMPGHPTFSTESIYSTRRTPGGTWKKVGLGPVYNEEFVDSKYTRKLKTYQNVSFALGGDNLKQNGYIEPSVITVPLPKKFKGSQAAAIRYAEGYQFGKKIANERDKTVPYILAAANAPMLVEGLAVAPLATIGSLAGGHIGGTIGNKVGGPLGGAIGGLIGGGLGAGAGVGIKAGIKPTIKYGNGVLDRTAEALIRLGDAAHTPNEVAAQFLNKNTLKYIFNPKAKNLAYKLPYKYSGQSTELTDAFPGDVVDQFLGKSPVPNATYDYSILPKGMQKYIAKNYPDKKIPIRNLGEVSSNEFSIHMNPKIREQFKTGQSINVGGNGNINDLSGNRLLDAGGFNAVIKNAEPINNNGYTLANVKGTDIWKFNSKDYSNRYGFIPTDLIKKLGLKFIDSRGTPIVHTFESQVPIYTGKINYKYGGIHIKPSKRGTFTAAAKRHHMGVQEFARKVLNNRARFSAAMVKKANFARNASKWHKKELGGDMTKTYYITRDNIYSLGGNVRPKAQLGTEGNIPIKKIKVNNRDAWDVDGRIVYSETEAYRLAGRIANIRGSLDMSETLEPSIVTAERTKPTTVSSPTIDDIPITKIKVNGRDAWDVDGRIIFNEQEAYRYRGQLADIRGSLDMSETLNPSVVTAKRINKQTSSAQTNTVQEKEKVSEPVKRDRLPINTSGRYTGNLNIAPLRAYDGREVEAPTNGSSSSSTGGQRKAPRSSTTPVTTGSTIPTIPTIPIDYDEIEKLRTAENDRILSQSLNNDRILSQSLNYDILSPITGKSVSPLNVGLHKIGAAIKNNPEAIGLGINLTGNLATSLINRSAIKGMRYTPAPIPISPEKLPTEINVNPQVAEIKESAAAQERLIADNTADSRVALARRQRVRNNASRQYQTLMGEKHNTETQLLTADKLNRQGVFAQNVGSYNQWRAGLYDFNNKKREMQAENSVAGINNAAEAIAGERGYLARREAKNRDLLNMGLIAATAPNAQKVIGSEEFEKFLRSLGYDSEFSLLRKRIKK